ncbi:MAG TPA: TIGR04283 family arsenosugar biosynthesis glycosyltransferase [Chthoniobacterales bacterium]|nr:TIGR04283 family arsenosugar biosynthesis glycosyltransferase [Chthoniobacterales bacterium]
MSAKTAGATAHHLLSISIVVPVLNEGPLIAEFLRHLRERAPEAEVIVVDGRSTDGTRAFAEPLCDRLLLGEAGRAHQLNLGATVARGDVLWFLHADSEVPTGSLDEIRRALATPDVSGGYFRIRLPKKHIIYRLTDSFAHYVGIVLRIRCGDHGFFCRRGLFFQCGGFPDVPLMEDVEFFRKLHDFGRVRVVHRRMKTSTRRYEQFGRARVTFIYALIASLYACRVPLRLLAEIHTATCQPPADLGTVRT